MKTITDSIRSENQHTPIRYADLIAHAWRLRAQNKLSAAADCCRRLLDQSAEFDEAWHLLGLVQWDQGERDTAIAYLQQAIRLKPNQPLHYNTIGVMLIETEDYIRAGAYLNKALKHSPNFSDARCNLGLSLFHQNKPEQAINCFNQVLADNPDHCTTLANLGMTHLILGNMISAAAAYEKALSIKPGQPRWQGNLGAAYLGMARFSEAIQCFQGALRADPKNLNYCVNMGIALRAVGDWPGSIETLESALRASSNHGPALANLAVAYEQTCQWGKLAPLYQRLDRLTHKALDRGLLPDEQPLLNIRRCSDPAQNLAVARAWSRDAERRALKVANRFTHTRDPNSNNLITIGYLSYDFRNHPVAHQLSPLFGMHDRNRFCVKTFSMGPDDGSVFRRNIQHDSDIFVDISKLGLKQAVGKIVEHQVDILIDLMGHTDHNRMEILALKPAPLQVGYLGFLSSTGADFMDYLIADTVVIPHGHTKFYSEKIIRMPHCYQMNHRFMLKKEPPTHRKDWNLPENGFVFCSFNQAYKIEPDLYDAWMRILQQVPHSVLWLFRDNSLALSQLKSAASRCNIDLNRIIFADKLPLRQHLHRLQLADLALDTVIYNGGATTANCLCAGVPVLTVLGQHWVSRMSASHLTAVDLSELIVKNLDNYEKVAISFGNCPHKIQSIRQRLRNNTSTHPLFDDRQFVLDLETAFEHIWRRHCAGLLPDSIQMEPRTGFQGQKSDEVKDS